MVEAVRKTVATANESWWRTFFDEEYYRLWSDKGAFDRTDELVEGILSMLDHLPPQSKVLDVPCGFGRISKPLSEAGFRVVGIDASLDQIRLAEDLNPGPDYRIADMREPGESTFDCVLNIFTSFGYFETREEDKAALKAWYRALRVGGVLLMVLDHRDQIVWMEAQRHQANSLEGQKDPGTPVTRRESMDWASGVRTVTTIQNSKAMTYRVRYYSVSELLQALQECGFSQVSAFSDFAGSPVVPQQGLVVRAVK